MSNKIPKEIAEGLSTVEMRMLTILGEYGPLTDKEAIAIYNEIYG